MLIFDKEEIIKVFNLRPSGTKGWFTGNCPYCGAEQKFGVIFSNTISSFNCYKKSKCGKHGTLYQLLEDFNLSHLSEKKKINIHQRITNILNLNLLKQIELKTLKTINLVGFKEIDNDKYLEDRGFIKKHYRKFNTHINYIDPKYKDYIFFIYKENDEPKFWLGRIRRSKEDTKKEKIVKRYINQPGIDVEQILWGKEEITENTSTVILVEGIMKKKNIDDLLNLENQEDIKCGFTFGGKISDYQIKILLSFPNLVNIIILFDNDIIKKIKKYSFELSKYFHVQVGTHEDIGDASYEEVLNILNNLKTPFQFYSDFIQINKLR